MLPEKIIELARLSIGVHEETPNWGRWIKQYLAAVGLYTPQPWCAAFVVFKVYQAAEAFGVKAKLPRSGSCQTLFTWANKRGLIRRTPQVGDIFLQWHPELNRYAHTGFVAKVDTSPKRFTSVEGNSNDDGSREGKEVCSNPRPLTPGKYVFFAPQ